MRGGYQFAPDVRSRHAGDRAGPGRDTMTTGPTPALMKQINEAFNSRDVDRIMSFFAEDCTFLADDQSRHDRPEARGDPLPREPGHGLRGVRSSHARSSDNSR